MPIVGLERYIKTVLKMPSEGMKSELITRLNNMSGLSGTPMSPLLTKWVQSNIGLFAVQKIQNYVAGGFSPDELRRFNGLFPNTFEGYLIRVELYDALNGGGVVPPVANFSGSPTTVYAGDTVSFTDLSTNTPTSWSWAFAGGTPTTSTTQNPSVVYNTAGTYGVDLTATNAGGSDPESKPNYITVNYPYLLDLYPGATAGYSVRKLSSTYTGAAIRVRRSSDNTESDIGFDSNGNLDETALTTFVGANNGFVTKWYDQGGNARDFSQTTASNQPRIVSSGTIDKANNIASIFFGQSNDINMTISVANEPAFDFTNTYSIYICAKPANQTGDQTIFGKGANLFAQTGYYISIRETTSNTAYLVINNSSSSPNYNVLYSNTSINLGCYGFNLSAGNGKASFNGTINNNYTGLISAALNNQQPRIGQYGTAVPNAAFDGWFSELIVYPTDQSANRIGIETNITNYYSI
jgi:PKD repeat protein